MYRQYFELLWEILIKSLWVHYLHKYLHMLFGIFLHGTYIYFPIFMYLFNHLFVSVWTHRYFIHWCVIQYHLIYFIAQFVLALALRGSFNELLCPSDTPTSVCVCACVHPYFGTIQYASGFFCFLLLS